MNTRQPQLGEQAVHLLVGRGHASSSTTAPGVVGIQRVPARAATAHRFPPTTGPDTAWPSSGRRASPAPGTSRPAIGPDTIPQNADSVGSSAVAQPKNWNPLTRARWAGPRRQDRVVQHRRVAEPGEQLRVGPDQRVVEQVHQVAGAVPPVSGMTSATSGSANIRRCRPPAAGPPAQVAAPVQHPVRHLHRVPPADEVGGQPVQLAGVTGEEVATIAVRSPGQSGQGFISCMAHSSTGLLTPGRRGPGARGWLRLGG